MYKEELKLVKQLCENVVLPAKARIAAGETEFKLITDNPRFLRTTDKSERPASQKLLRDWRKEFETLKLDLEMLLRILIQHELGVEFDIEENEFSGYLGWGDCYYQLILVKPSRRKTEDQLANELFDQPLLVAMLLGANEIFPVIDPPDQFHRFIIPTDKPTK